MAVNYRSMAAIKTDGTLWAWGQGSYGILGLGNQSGVNSPVQVGALTNWLTISGGAYHTVAIKTNGTLWAWGVGSNGDLGLGNTGNNFSPVQVGGLTTWLTAAAGYQWTLATHS